MFSLQFTQIPVYFYCTSYTDMHTHILFYPSFRFYHSLKPLSSMNQFQRKFRFDCFIYHCTGLTIVFNHSTGPKSFSIVFLVVYALRSPLSERMNIPVAFNNYYNWNFSLKTDRDSNHHGNYCIHMPHRHYVDEIG